MHFKAIDRCTIILFRLPGNNPGWLLRRWCDSLTVLPGSLGQARRLSCLHLMNCFRLAALPASLGGLTGEHCDGNSGLLFQNAFACLPHVLMDVGIAVLAELTTLEPIQCVSLVRLPVEVGNLHQLTLLDCEGCRALESLPDSLSCLQRLQCINVKGCAALLQLPTNMDALTALTRLDLTHCASLRHLPESLTHLTNLSYFSRSGCSSLQLGCDFAKWTALLYCRRIEINFGIKPGGVGL